MEELRKNFEELIKKLGRVDKKKLEVLIKKNWRCGYEHLEELILKNFFFWKLRKKLEKLRKLGDVN